MIFLIEYTSGEKWEITKGLCGIIESKRTKAIKLFHEQVKNRKITSIKQIKTKNGIIFNKDVSLL